MENIMEKERVLTDFAKVINSDRYQYTESDIYLEEGLDEKIAVFDVFFRKTEDGGFAVVSGVNDVIDLIKILNNTTYEEKKTYFSKILEEENLIEFLSNLKFTGSIYAMRDGEIAYPNEPIITINAPLIEAKILETPILNIINHQMAVATKASRVTRAAGTIPVSSFGSRRAHGFDSSINGNKAAFIGGCANHSNLVTEYRYDIPSIGTMSHSYIQTFGVGKEAEKKAFDTFIKVRKNRKKNTIILLVDTYNTLEIGIKNAIESFKENGIDDNYNGIYGIRIDSGDLAYLSKKCRKMLDDAGLKKATITLTNGLDEDLISTLLKQDAAVNYFGVGDAIAVSKSNPCFGGVYKIVEIDNEPVIKLSEDLIKISNPGFKSVYRIYQNNEAKADLICLKNNDNDVKKIVNKDEIIIRDERDRFKKTKFEKDSYTIKELNIPFIENGIFIKKNLELINDVVNCRNYYLENLTTFSEERKRLIKPHKYKIDLSQDLYNLKYNLIESITNQIEK
jgi:nicotinate phosphoribosyltransferase